MAPSTQQSRHSEHDLYSERDSALDVALYKCTWGSAYPELDEKIRGKKHDKAAFFALWDQVFAENETGYTEHDCWKHDDKGRVKYMLTAAWLAHNNPYTGVKIHNMDWVNQLTAALRLSEAHKYPKSVKGVKEVKEVQEVIQSTSSKPRQMSYNGWNSEMQKLQCFYCAYINEECSGVQPGQEEDEGTRCAACTRDNLACIAPGTESASYHEYKQNNTDEVPHSTYNLQ